MKENQLRIFQEDEHLLAILIDPQNVVFETLEQLVKNLPEATTHIFVGGSQVDEGLTEKVVDKIKKFTFLPVILFPGDHTQITQKADGLLFLSLLSGRNPEFLIEQHVKSIRLLRNSDLEIIPTAYLLIDGHKKTSVEHVSQTTPMPQNNIEAIVNTALAGQFSGKKLIYLETGSGAKITVLPEVVSAVKEAVTIPIIVGGGIKTKEQINALYQAGATMLVVGTAFENNPRFLKERSHEKISTV